MAIKEFEIKPSEYYAAGYFDGDYIEGQNFSVATLTCDFDRIVGFEFQAGFYFEEGYIDGTFTFVNSIIAELEVEAMVVQLAEIKLGSYYQEGYFESGYYENRGSFFTLTAELERFGQDVFAEADLTATASLAAAVGKTVDINADLVSEFSQSTFASNLFGTDLVAFSEAELTADISRIRDNNIEALAAFDISADAVATFDVEVFADIGFILASTPIRSRDAAVSITSDTTLSAELLKVQLAQADLLTTAGLAATATKLKRFTAPLTAISTLSAVSGFKDRHWIKKYRLKPNTGFTDMFRTGFAGFKNSYYAVNVPLATQVTNTKDQFLDKLDNLGNLLWTTKINYPTGIPSAPQNNIIESSQGNVYVSVNINITSTHDGVVSKFNNQGSRQWSTRIFSNAAETGTIQDSINSIYLDSDENCFVVGLVRGNTPGSFIVKLSPTGSLLWRRQFNFVTTFELRDMAFDIENNIIAHVAPQPNISSDVSYIVKLTNDAGNILWQKKIVNNTNTQITSTNQRFRIHVNRQNNIYLLASPRMANGQLQDVIFKLNSDGALLDAKASNQRIEDFVINENNELIIALPNSIAKVTENFAIIYNQRYTNIKNQQILTYQMLSIDEKNNILTSGRILNSEFSYFSKLNTEGHDLEVYGNPSEEIISISSATGFTLANPSPNLTLDDVNLSIVNSLIQVQSLIGSTSSSVAFADLPYTITNVDLDVYSRILEMTVTAQLTVIRNRIRNVPAALSANASVNCTATVVKTAASDLTAVTALGCSATRVRTYDISAAAVTNAAVTAQRIRNNNIVAESQSLLNVDIFKFVGIISSLDSTASLSADIDRIREFSSDFASIVTKTVAIGRILKPGASMFADFEITTAADVIAVANITTASEFTLDCDVEKVVGFDSTLDSSTELVVEPDIFRNVSSDMFSEFTTDTAAEVLSSVECFADSEFTLTVTDKRFRDIESSTSSDFSLDCDFDVFRIFSSDMFSEFTVTPFTQKLVRVEADLVASAFKLTVGEVYNLDPALTLKIAKETRDLEIIKETREIMVKPETRVNTIIRG
jgi:hypothetical protein